MHCTRSPMLVTENGRQQLPLRLDFPIDLSEMTDGKQLDANEIINMLAPFMTEERVDRIQAVAAKRTFNVLPIVEGLYDMGNLAAVCRSADAMGFGAVHCINTNKDRYKQSSRTSAGADKWLKVKVWNNGTTEALTAVKEAGFQIIATHLSKSSVTIQEVDWTRPTAFVLGNECSGISDEAVALADHCAIIPMAGFVESFNISVAAALVMYEAQQQRVRKLGSNADLTPEQQRILQAALMLKGLKSGPTMIREMLSRPPRPWQSAKLRMER